MHEFKPGNKTLKTLKIILNKIPYIHRDIIQSTSKLSDTLVNNDFNYIFENLDEFSEVYSIVSDYHGGNVVYWYKDASMVGTHVLPEHDSEETNLLVIVYTLILFDEKIESVSGILRNEVSHLLSASYDVKESYEPDPFEDIIDKAIILDSINECLEDDKTISNSEINETDTDIHWNFNKKLGTDIYSIQVTIDHIENTWMLIKERCDNGK